MFGFHFPYQKNIEANAKKKKKNQFTLINYGLKHPFFLTKTYYVFWRAHELCSMVREEDAHPSDLQGRISIRRKNKPQHAINIEKEIFPDTNDKSDPQWTL